MKLRTDSSLASVHRRSADRDLRRGGTLRLHHAQHKADHVLDEVAPEWQAQSMNPLLNRRAFFQMSAAASGMAAATPLLAAEKVPDRISKGRIRQSIMGWTFNPMPTPELAKLCKQIGLVAMEGIGAEHYPMVKELGLEVSLVGVTALPAARSIQQITNS